MGKPLVSIYSCTYNSEKHIRETIESVVAQTYDNKEFIIVDDCSTDSTPEILLDYAKRYNWIKVIILTENLHCVNASNIAYRNCKGVYIGGIAHDDMWMPEKLEKQVKFLEENKEYAVCFSHCEIVDSQGNDVTQNTFFGPLFNQENKTQKQWINALIRNNQFCCASALIRRECLGLGNFYKYGLLMLQDYEMWLRVIKDYPVYILQEKLTKYRWFMNEGTNLSTPSVGNSIRTAHERAYFVYRFFRDLPNEQLIEYFGDSFVDPLASSPCELEIEKALLMIKNGICQGIDYFIDLLEKDETRNTLKEVYNFSVQDFYKLNAKSILYDPEPTLIINLQKKKLEEVQGFLEKISMERKSNYRYYIICSIDDTIDTLEFWKHVFPKCIYAMENGMLPIFDTQHFKIGFLENEMNNPFYKYYCNISGLELEDIYGLKNETYKVSSLSLSEEEQSKYIDFSESTWINDKDIDVLSQIYNDVFVCSNRIEDITKSIWNSNVPQGGKLLGLSINGLTERMNNREVKLLEEKLLNDLEDKKCAFILAYNLDETVYSLLTDRIKCVMINMPSYSENEFENELIESELLARCDSLTGVLNSQTVMAIMRNAGRYDYIDV